MIQFILNDTLIKTEARAGSTLLDFVRYQQRLPGTKIGCREGDCGACTLLMGELEGGKMTYKSLTSCITPLGNAQGKHIVSIEGLNVQGLTPYQQAMVDESGQQCGFCTVGFIVSFAGECLSERTITYESVISAIDGNICRCTGYKSIERAAKIIYEKLLEKDADHPIQWLVNNHFIPSYFLDIPRRLQGLTSPSMDNKGIILGGGTDLLVQRHDDIYESDVALISGNKELIGIEILNNQVVIKGATNTTMLLHSAIMKDLFPSLYKHLKLVSSTPIRNIATVAGNFINASPIGDLTAFFVALNSDLELSDPAGNTRILKLKKLYKGYKILDKAKEEYIKSIRFPVPDNNTRFNFEKVSKRRYLDIASVNTAMSIRLIDDLIEEVHISAGGVGPTPLYLEQTCHYLKGKSLDGQNVRAAMGIMLREISPISDARGSKSYKSLLLRQLIYAHFIELYPERFNIDVLA